MMQSVGKFTNQKHVIVKWNSVMHCNFVNRSILNAMKYVSKTVIMKHFTALGCVRTGSDNACVRCRTHARVKIWDVHTGTVRACDK